MAAEPASTPRILHIASWYPSAVHGTLGNFVERHVQAISTLNGGEIWFAAAVPAGEVVPANSERDCGTYTERIFYFRARKPVVRHITRALLRAAEEASDFDLIHLHVAYPAGCAARKTVANGASHSFSQNTGQHTIQTNAHPFPFGAMVHEVTGKWRVCCVRFRRI